MQEKKIQFLIYGPCLLHAGDSLNVDTLQMIADRLESKLYFPDEESISSWNIYNESLGLSIDYYLEEEIHEQHYLLGLYLDLDKPDTYPLDFFWGRQLWMLPHQEERLFDCIKLYHEKNIDYVLADFFPDEYEDQCYGELWKWFYQHWLFWPGQWRFDLLGSAREKHIISDLLGCPIALSEKIIEDGLLPENSDLIDVYEPSEFLDLVKFKGGEKLIIAYDLDSIVFLQGLFYTEGCLVYVGSLKSPLLSFLFKKQIYGAEGSSLRMLYRHIFEKGDLSLSYFSKRLLSLLSIDYFKELRSFLYEGDESKGILFDLNRVFSHDLDESLYGLSWIKFQCAPKYMDLLPIWILNREARRTFHALYLVLENDYLEEARALLRSFAIGLLLQPSISFGIEGIFRSNYLYYDDFLSICKDAVSDILSQYPNKTGLYARLSAWIRCSLLYKNLGIDSDASLLEFCQYLSKAEVANEDNPIFLQVNKGFVSAEQQDWRLVDNALKPIKNDLDLADDYWEELAHIAFRQQDFIRAEKYYASMSAAGHKAYRWQYVVAIAMVKGIQSALDKLKELYEVHNLDVSGLGSIAAHNFFFQMPDLFLEEDGASKLTAPWDLLLDLIDFDIAQAKGNRISDRYYLVFSSFYPLRIHSEDVQPLLATKRGKNAWLIFFEFLNQHKDIGGIALSLDEFLQAEPVPLDQSLLFLGALLTKNEEALKPLKKSGFPEAWLFGESYLFIQIILGSFYKFSGNEEILNDWRLQFRGNRFFHPTFENIVDALTMRISSDPSLKSLIKENINV